MKLEWDAPVIEELDVKETAAGQPGGFFDGFDFSS